MRIDVKKFLFLGVKNQLQTFLRLAQEVGLIHFIDQRSQKIREVSGVVENIMQAIRVLRGLPEAEQIKVEETKGVNRLALKVLHLQDLITRLEEEEKGALLEMSRQRIFGRFSLDDVRYVAEKGKRILRFFFAKRGRVQESNSLFFVGTELGLDYFVSIESVGGEMSLPDELVEIKIEHSLQDLERNVFEIRREKNAAEMELKALSSKKSMLEKALLLHLDRYHLEVTSKFADDVADDRLFVVEGWIPENKVDMVHALLKDMEIQVDEIAVESDDHVPTYLENEGLSRLGEDLVHVYDTPSASDKDPSLWVLLSFALFFAMIIGDGGYGLIFLLAALYFRFRKGVKSFRILNLVLVLCVFCVGWGALTHSFFGMQLSPKSALRKVSPLQRLAEKKVGYHRASQDAAWKEFVLKYPEIESKQSEREILEQKRVKASGYEVYELLDSVSNSILLELSLLFGIIHVTCGFVRYLRRNLAGIGWILALFGGYLYFPHYLGAPSLVQYLFDVSLESAGREGLNLMGAGLFLALFLAVYQRRFLGLLEITSIVQVFADVLSYLRLYALGLAGSIISATVNEIAASLPLYILSILLLVIGHSFNMVLSIISGVIHGLRLNFIEWYHYCFEGGGRLFAPLKKIRT